MTAIADITERSIGSAPRGCSTAANITRSLLGYLALAGPFYVVVSLTLALTRPGFSLSRHEWSLLTVGHHGWIQTANLVLTGAMVVAGAVGVRRAVGRTRSAGTWAHRLFAGYGFALAGAGVFRPDPADGFPAGTPAGPPAQVSWHSLLHLLFGAIGFACLIAACFVITRRYARSGRRRAAAASRTIGVFFVVAFAGIASGAGNSAINLAFTAAIIASSGWLTYVAVDLYRRTRHDDPAMTGLAR
jgi:Protein of unknown function (DUF998)